MLLRSKLFLKFLFSLFNVFLVPLVMWRIFVILFVAGTFLLILFLFLRRTLCNTWKSYYRQLQVLIMIFTKILLPIFLASPAETTQLKESFWIWYQELNEFLQSEIMQKSRTVQNITNIMAVVINNQVQFVWLWCCVPVDWYFK